MAPITPETVPDNVWEYPRPPRLERTPKLLRVELDGETVAETRRGMRVLETTHPPTYYFPYEDVRMNLLNQSDARATGCEWKGLAEYLDIGGHDRLAWRYPDADDAFKPIWNWIAFYAHAPLVCTVDGIRAEPQEGGFYGGWITPELVGPFKGGPGTLGW